MKSKATKLTITALLFFRVFRVIKKAGEDAREPEGRRGFPYSQDFWRLPRSLDGFSRQVVARGRATSRGGFRLRLFVMHTSNKA